MYKNHVIVCKGDKALKVLYERDKHLHYLVSNSRVLSMRELEAIKHLLFAGGCKWGDDFFVRRLNTENRRQ